MLAVPGGAMRIGRLCMWAGLCLAALAGRARADEASVETRTFEQAQLDAALARAQLVVDPAPFGKIIAYVRYERREVFERGDGLLVPIVLPDFAPTWPNHFHWLTSEDTIARELLLHEGDRFDPELAEESMRNLRELGTFALVRIVAVQTEDPQRVGLVVYTRDLWSLRLETEFAGVGSTFSLAASVVERNFLGRNKELTARVFLDPLTYSVGETYLDPRIAGGRFRLYEALDLIVNRGSGNPEGSYGTLLWGIPFHDLEQEQAFDLLLGYADYIYRDQRAGEVLGFEGRDVPSHGKACPPGAPGCITRAWDDQSVRVEAAFHERIGVRYKQTFTGGAGFADRQVAANAETHLAPGLRRVFETEVLPRVRREAYPFVRYRLSLPRFATFSNLATFGQSETVQTGPQIDARFALPLEAFGSSSDGFVPHGTLAYVWAQRDMLLDAGGDARARLEGSSVVDQEAILRVRAASPSFRALFGRLVISGVWDARRQDTQRTFVSLGGNTGLRGYSSDHFFGFGASSWIGNLEYRTKPVELRSVQLGMVAFYDAGSVYRKLETMQVHHDAGLGLRVLFPQLNRYVFRVDWGVPLDRGGFAVTLSYGSAQAVPLTAAEDALASTELAPTN